MKETTQFCVGIENKPGTLANLCRSLREANINIDALFVSGDDEGTWVNLIVSPIGEAQDALARAGYDFYTEPVFTLQARNRPGELEQIAHQLAEAEVNINYIYGSTLGDAPFTLVLHVSNPERASGLFED